MSDVSSVRLDTWLWAARFFKTRAVAAAAIDGGKVEVNGARAKRAKQLRVGDRLRVRKDPFQYELTGLPSPVVREMGFPVEYMASHNSPTAGSDLRWSRSG